MSGRIKWTQSYRDFKDKRRRLMPDWAQFCRPPPQATADVAQQPGDRDMVERLGSEPEACPPIPREA
jgi:hypothetical protein